MENLLTIPYVYFTVTHITIYSDLMNNVVLIYPPIQCHKEESVHESYKSMQTRTFFVILEFSYLVLWLTVATLLKVDIFQKYIK